MQILTPDDTHRDGISIHSIQFKFSPCGLMIRIQPTFALVRVVRVDLSRDMNCPMPPAH